MSDHPPLNALRAFEAALRLNSFALAAGELNVTPGAVGQQVRKLEDWLGVRLFQRSVRQIQPTAEALEYGARIAPALHQLADASRSLRDRHDNTVRVVMPPSFAAKWFSSRMSRFLIEHPTTDLHVGSSSTLNDFSRDPIDLAVRYYDGVSGDLESVLIYQGRAAAYCAPAYRKAQRLRKPADIAGATLLNDTLHAWWNDWLGTFAGLDTEQCRRIRRIEIDQTPLAIEAAIHGQGVLLANPLLAEEDVSQGKLEALFPEAVLTVPYGYYLVYPKHRELRGQVRVFRDWLLEEAREIAG